MTELDGVTQGGDPTDEELAAIVAAIEATWPYPTPTPQPGQPPRWRFSGRWWSKPSPLRRARPAPRRW